MTPRRPPSRTTNWFAKLFAGCGLAISLGACSTQRLPAGTPPPEYEPNVVPEWPARSSSAVGDVRDAGPGADASLEPDVDADPQLSPGSKSQVR